MRDCSSDVCSSDLLGFTEYEARVYVQLLRHSPATAYEIAKAASVPRPNTYHALEALAKRGAVLPVSENPIRYVAANPREFLDSISRQTKALRTALAGKLATRSEERRAGKERVRKCRSGGWSYQ